MYRVCIKSKGWSGWDEKGRGNLLDVHFVMLVEP